MSGVAGKGCGPPAVSEAVACVADMQKYIKEPEAPFRQRYKAARACAKAYERERQEAEGYRRVVAYLGQRNVSPISLLLELSKRPGQAAYQHASLDPSSVSQRLAYQPLILVAARESRWQIRQ